MAGAPAPQPGLTALAKDVARTSLRSARRAAEERDADLVGRRMHARQYNETRAERHKLKENEFARKVVDASAQVSRCERARRAISRRSWSPCWSCSSPSPATAGGEARETPREPGARVSAGRSTRCPSYPPPPAPGSPPPVPQPGTFQTEQEKFDASLPKFLEAANAYPNSTAGIAARFHAAAILAQQGKGD